MTTDMKHILDGVSLTAVVGTLSGFLPVIAAFFSIVWTLIRIYETKTVQQWLGYKEVNREISQ